MELAIVIPTMNRSELLLGQLFFYDSYGYKIKVYIGDSSTEDHKKIIRKGITQLKNISVDFIDCPASMMQVEVIIDLINKTKEEYITVSGDDDYHIIPHALKSIEFLKNNPNYVSCTGSVAMVSTYMSNGLRVINDIVDYSPKTDIKSNDPLDRIKLLADNYYLPLFCICRTKDFIEAFKANEKIKNNIFWAETLPAFKLIAIGNQNVIEGLAMIRGVHDLRPDYKDSFADTFMNKDWIASLNTTIETILTYLQNKGEDLEKARPRINKIFSDYYLVQIVRMELSKSQKIRFRQRLPRSVKNFLKSIYFRFKPNEINTGSQKPYSIFYKDFQKLKNSYEMVKELFK